MTVSTTVTKVIYSGNGSNTYYPITFPYGLSQNNIGVYITDLDGVIVKLLNSQYDYDQPNLRVVYPKVEIPALTPMPTGYKLTIVRETAPLQEVDLVNQGPFTAQGIELSFDKAVMLIQELIEKVTRCIQYPVDQNPTSTETSGFLNVITQAKADALAAQLAASASALVAAASEANSLGYATDSANSASAALSYADSASNSATNAYNYAVAAQTPTNVSQDSTHRFVSDTQIADWNAEKTKIDTIADLTTWAASASNASRAYGTDTALYYIVINNTLNEVNFLRTINGTITTAQVTVGTTQVRATVSGSAPSASRKKLVLKPDKNNTGSIYYGGTGLTISTATEIIGPDGIYIEWDASDYYLISDVVGQKVHVQEVV